MAVQVNGKVRARVEVAPDASESDAESLALADRSRSSPHLPDAHRRA